MPPLLYPFRVSTRRLRVELDDPAAITAARRARPGFKTATHRRQGRCRASPDRRHPADLCEIAARTSVGRASICRWTRDNGWQRHTFAPHATETIPRPRAGLKLKLRLLAERLRALAERYVRELEESASVDLDRLVQALEVVKMARLEAMGRSHRGRMAIIEHAMSAAARDEITRRALNEMRLRGVDVERAPKEALDLLIDARTPEEDHPVLRARGRRR